MDATNREVLDYYLLPRLDIAVPKLRLREENAFSLDAYLLDHGEERLLAGIDRGVIPTSVAMEIAWAKDTENPNTFGVLRKMKPMRQVDAAELMSTAGNYTASYAKALLAATRQIDLVKSDRPKQIAEMTIEQMARMEREMEKVQRDLKTVESRYGEDVLELVIASGYLAKLTRNTGIKRY